MIRVREGRCAAALVAAGVAVCVLLTVGCDGANESARGGEEQPTNTQGTRAQPQAQRLVSLAPALTQMVVDLGLADALIAVAEHDAAAPEGLPVVGNFIDPDIERIVALDPTHVVMTQGKSGVPERLVAIAYQHDFELAAYEYPQSIDDVANTLTGGDRDTLTSPPLGEVLDRREQAAALRRQMLDELDALRAETADLPQPRTLMLLSVRSPVMAIGGGTVHDELLRYAGGENAAGDSLVTAPTFDREALVELNPQTILLLMPGALPLAERWRDDPRLAVLADLPIDAVRHDRIHLINDELALLPSTSLSRIAQLMAEALHPEFAGQVRTY